MARRTYRRGKYYGSRRGGKFTAGRGKNAIGINLSPAFLAGVAVGYTDMDKSLPANAVLAASAAPVKGLGMVKAAAQGVIIGNIIQGMTGGNKITGTTARQW